MFTKGINEEECIYDLARKIYAQQMDILEVTVFEFFCNLSLSQKQIYIDAAKHVFDCINIIAHQTSDMRWHIDVEEK